MTLTVGTRLGPYEVLGSIGVGGMGEVYRAHDPRLGRDVAIKVLPERLATDSQALARFERESKALAALSHPNILAIFDAGSEEGINYAVAELLHGETLRARLLRGALPWRRAAEIGAALAEGLAAAHSKAVIHRDLKPDNIFLTADNRIKILDFGIAQFRSTQGGEDTVTQGVTQDGAILGTIGYMSPEQLRGAPVSPGTDIFSLGCVLYEMISGRRAFAGQTSAETMSAILRDQPPELTTSGIQIPAEIERLISHCLEKNPDERFQSARDLTFDLKTILGTSVRRAEPAAETGKALNSIAVLPFVNASRDPDTEYLSEGITESIINSLVQIAQLRVTPRSTVFRYKGKDIDPQAAGREMNVRVVLAGRVMQRGEALVVGAELIDVADGSLLWGERYNRKLADVFALEEEIASKISENLRMKLTGDEKKRLAKRFTENTEAYQLYLKGRHYWSKRTPETVQKASEYFKHAIEKDPAYALAYAGLADCHSLVSCYCLASPRENWAKAKAAAAAAVALDPELSEGYTSLAFIRAFSDWNWEAAENDFRRAIELNPNYWVAAYWFAVMFSATARYEEGEQQIRRGREMEPLSPVVLHGAAWNSVLAGRYGEAIERCQKGLEIDPDYFLLHMWLGITYECQSRYEDAIGEFENAVQRAAGISFVAAALGHAHAMAGHEAEARKILAELISPSDGRPADFYAVALVHVGLRQTEEAVISLEKGCEFRSGFAAVMAKGDPRMNSIRHDPRYQKTLQRMGLA